jgi:hypothetical protein
MAMEDACVLAEILCEAESLERSGHLCQEAQTSSRLGPVAKSSPGQELTPATSHPQCRFARAGGSDHTRQLRTAHRATIAGGNERSVASTPGTIVWTGAVFP